jgi:hypothetical protein
MMMRDEVTLVPNQMVKKNKNFCNWNCPFTEGIQYVSSSRFAESNFFAFPKSQNSHCPLTGLLAIFAPKK